MVELVVLILYGGTDEEVSGEWVLESGDVVTILTVLATYEGDDGDGNKSERPALLRLLPLFKIPKSGCLSMMAGRGSLNELDSCCSLRMLFLYSEFSWIRSSSIDDGVWMLSCDCEFSGASLCGLLLLVGGCSVFFMVVDSADGERTLMISFVMGSSQSFGTLPSFSQTLRKMFSKLNSDLMSL